MNNTELENCLKSFGKVYDDLRRDQSIPPVELFEVYPGAWSMYLELAQGCYLSFWSETKTLEALQFSLIATVPESPTYEGELPEPYRDCLTRALVLQEFGEPQKSKGPFRMPKPMNEVGGFDKVSLESRGHKSLSVVFKYDVNLRVTGIHFTFDVTRFDRLGAEVESA